MTVTDTGHAASMTDRMKIYDDILRDRGHGSLRDFLAVRCAGPGAQSWDRTAEDLRMAMAGTGYAPPRWSVTQMASRFGIVSEYTGGSRPAMTDRMRQYEALLREHGATGNAPLRDFIAERYARNRAWKEIARELREAIGDSTYVVSHESVIHMALRLGIIAERPRGKARARRRSGS